MSKFKPIGKCIYCGQDTSLSDEHIVPFALNGTWILPKASCLECAKITSAFEGRAIKMFETFRQAADLKTRRPAKRKKTVLLKDDNGNPLEMPNEGMWHRIPTIQYKLPGIYRKDWEFANNWVGVILGIRFKETTSEQKTYWKKFNTKKFHYSTPKFDIENYALLLAKIAHCICVANYGVDNFVHFLTPFILGKESLLATDSLDLESENDNSPLKYPIPLNISYFVGSFNEILDPHAFEHEYSYEIQICEIPKIEYILYARIRLFPFAGGPTACVVVGKANQKQYERCMKHLTNLQ